eukprot:CAMPEP_0114994314 /NCGR_PEP_ID=MMETSP0216-20121206/13053_1 /TAXON_ID=223996 /ORGANISM="Protocruzia adherens, Strain Boccale" /LENGTH=377 /DNA_ID=CAMNT_0002358127 /DNA_START=103 /DNA_END=1236 /DNA_ORIENTATION=-
MDNSNPKLIQNDSTEVDPNKPKKVKRQRSRKAPGAPKRGLSAYMIFGKEIRQEVIETMPEAPVTEVMKEIGKRWGLLPDEEKEKYNELAAEDKKRYEEEKKNYTGPLSIPPKKKNQEPQKPKRGLSAYMLYAKEVRDKVCGEFPELKTPDIMREIGRRWNNLDDEDKKTYQEQAEIDKERYKREQSEFLQEQIKLNGKKGKKDVTAPKRPLSAYMFYNKLVRDRVKEEMGGEIKVTEVMKEVGRRWVNMNDEDKIPYGEMAAKDKARYEREVAEVKKNANVEEKKKEPKVKKSATTTSQATTADPTPNGFYDQRNPQYQVMSHMDPGEMEGMVGEHDMLQQVMGGDQSQGLMDMNGFGEDYSLFSGHFGGSHFSSFT